MSVNGEDLLEEISGYLHGYLKAGKVKINSFLAKMNLNISNLEQLLIIRFLLKDETIQFVRELPNLLKRFKTTTTMKSDVYIGEVRGQIDWGETTKERLARNYLDKTIFSTTESVRSYNTPENLVLKQLLQILYSSLFKDEFIKGFEKAKWFLEWQAIKGNVSEALKTNIYLKRVDVGHVSDRLLQKTLTHRNRLYRDAANLLLAYRRLINGQYIKEDIEILLRETFISPENVDVLFELYWIVQIIKQNAEESKLYLMDGSNNLVASWETDIRIYKIYHNSTGSEAIYFNVAASQIAESSHPYLVQKYRSFTHLKDLASSIFGKSKKNYIWEGRPDFLIEIQEKETGRLDKLIIGEVKNTSNIDYAVKGMEELLDYIHLVKNNQEKYLVDSCTSVQGILCLGDVPFSDDVEVDWFRVVKRVRGYRGSANYTFNL
jgi:hypothetical protein